MSYSRIIMAYRMWWCTKRTWRLVCLFSLPLASRHWSPEAREHHWERKRISLILYQVWGGGMNLPLVPTSDAVLSLDMCQQIPAASPTLHYGHSTICHSLSRYEVQPPPLSACMRNPNIRQVCNRYNRPCSTYSKFLYRDQYSRRGL